MKVVRADMDPAPLMKRYAERQVFVPPFEDDGLPPILEDEPDE